MRVPKLIERNLEKKPLKYSLQVSFLFLHRRILHISILYLCSIAFRLPFLLSGAHRHSAVASFHGDMKERSRSRGLRHRWRKFSAPSEEISAFTFLSLRSSSFPSGSRSRYESQLNQGGSRSCRSRNPSDMLKVRLMKPRHSKCRAGGPK